MPRFQLRPLIPTGSRSSFAAALAFILLCLPASVASEKTRTPPGVGVDERAGERLPLDLEFKDEDGSSVTLGSFLKNDRNPVILVPGYYNCPRLCSLVFNGVRDGVAATHSGNLEPGKDYTILSVSFNPRETPDLARAKGDNYRASINGYPIAREGWRFLTGDQPAIDALMSAIGYNYRQDGEDYSHAAAFAVLAPDGTISRYLYGIQHRPYDFRLALVEAAEGRIGQPFDKVLLYCFRYDPQTGQYAPYAWAFLRLGGALTFVTLVGLIIFLWFSGRRSGNNA